MSERSFHRSDDSKMRAGGDSVNRQTARMLLTILMYAGVGLFLLPYVIEKASLAPMMMLVGALIAVACGLLRCYFTEE